MVDPAFLSTLANAVHSERLAEAATVGERRRLLREARRNQRERDRRRAAADTFDLLVAQPGTG